MSIHQLFERFPTISIIYQVGVCEFFIDKASAEDYASHFNLSITVTNRP